VQEGCKGCVCKLLMLFFFANNTNGHQTPAPYINILMLEWKMLGLSNLKTNIFYLYDIKQGGGQRKRGLGIADIMLIWYLIKLFELDQLFNN
jgi:hypothetical protein